MCLHILIYSHLLLCTLAHTYNMTFNTRLYTYLSMYYHLYTHTLTIPRITHMARPWDSALHGQTPPSILVVFFSIVSYLLVVSQVVLLHVVCSLIEHIEQSRFFIFVIFYIGWRLLIFCLLLLLRSQHRFCLLLLCTFLLCLLPWFETLTSTVWPDSLP